MKHDKKKQWLSIGLLTLGAAALAVFAAATLDAGDVRASLAALLPGWTAAIVGCMLLYYLCDALKYQLITRAFGCAQPLGDSIDTSMIGFFYSAVTPAAAATVAGTPAARLVLSPVHSLNKALAAQAARFPSSE